MTKPLIRKIFGRFRDLNLVALLADLGQAQVARQDWRDNGNLCPIAHGLSGEGVVRLVENSHLERGLARAAWDLGIEPDWIRRFIDTWDEGGFRRLEEEILDLWRERLAEADAVQAVLTGGRPAFAFQAEDVRGGEPCVEKS